MKQVLRAVVAIATLLTAAGAASGGDRLTSLNYLIGTWTCSYHAAGAPASTYSATFSPAIGGNWIEEADAYPGGGDIAFYTYDKKTKMWSITVVDSERATTIFRAADTGTDRLIWRSVFPDTSMMERFDKDSPTQFSIHFAQTVKGKTVTSWDVCKKGSGK